MTDDIREGHGTHCLDKDCDGVERYVVDPYIEEIYDRTEYGWFCDGEWRERKDDI